MANRIYREDGEQKALIQWADMTPIPPHRVLRSRDKIGDYLFAIPNGGARLRIEAARLKGLGVRPGVSDLFFSFPVEKYHGLYIEMKAPKPYTSSVTDAQKQFIDRMLLAGYAATICYGFEQAKETIEFYLE